MSDPGGYDKEVIDKATIGDEVEILVDNETAVNNLSRLANKQAARLYLRN